MTIAFTGATGQFGRLLAEELLARTGAENIVALARDPQKAADLAAKGIEVRAFDYDQPEALAGALAGVDKLLLVSGPDLGKRFDQHKAVIDAAAEAGVGFFAYTSFLHADTASRVAVVPDHQATEALLAAAPFDVALLRNGWYTENFEDLVKGALATGAVVGSTDGGRISSAARKDYVVAAAAVLTAETPEAGTYELAGDESWTLEDLAALLSEKAGREIPAQNVTVEELAAGLRGAGLPEPLVDFIAGIDVAIAAGELEDPAPGTMSALIGRPTTPLAEVVEGWL